MGKEWDKLTRNLMNPTSEADIARVAAYDGNYAGRCSKLPDLSGFAGRSNEVQAWHAGWLRECFRVLVPGGRILAFGGSRVYHRMAAAFDDAGFVDVGLEAWSYGSGFPKSHNIAVYADRLLTEGRSRNIVRHGVGNLNGRFAEAADGFVSQSKAHTVTTDVAKQWDGWGTALKPAWEPFIVGRKPLS